VEPQLFWRKLGELEAAYKRRDAALDDYWDAFFRRVRVPAIPCQFSETLAVEVGRTIDVPSLPDEEKYLYFNEGVFFEVASFAELHRVRVVRLVLTQDYFQVDTVWQYSDGDYEKNVRIEFGREWPAGTIVRAAYFTRDEDLDRLEEEAARRAPGARCAIDILRRLFVTLRFLGV